MARRRKRKITYDSKETLTFLGIVILITAILLLVAYFTGETESTNIIARLKNIFNNASPLVAAFLFLVSLRLFGNVNRFTKIPALIAQGLLVLVITALLSANTDPNNEFAFLEADGAETGGGIVGKYIIDDLLNSQVPTAPITKIVLWVFIVFLTPFALAFSPKQTVDFVTKVVKWISEGLKTIFAIFELQEEDKKKKDEEISDDTAGKPSRFGDFNELIRKRKEEEATKVHTEEPKQKEPNFDIAPAETKKKKKSADIEDVDVREGELGEDGLKQEELQFPDWKFPPMSLLTPFKKAEAKEASINENAKVIEQILSSFNIEATVEDAFIGPSVVQYALNIPLGIKVQKISALGENIALALGVDSKAVRIESIPETTYLGIEVPRSKRDMIRFKELMSSDKMQGTEMQLPVPIGKDINGDYIMGDIAKMPHLLIAGATGSGKSVVTNSFITSIMMKRTPDEVKFILVDPKQVELMDYNGTPYLLTPVVTDMTKVINALKWAVSEMETRYTNLANSQVRNIEQYNEKMGFAAMPYIVIVIDEMADMMMTSDRAESENAIVRIAQKARAVGIHLILATQRPSVNVITGIIKANIPGRIGMSVTSSTDSRVILDRIGAEALMGKGDLLYKAPDSTKVARLQGPYVEQPEIIRVVEFIKNQAPEVEYVNEITEKKVTPEEATEEALGEISEDNLVEQAIRLVVRTQKGSASYLQRRLSIGFNRAARLLDELEEAGVVGPPNGSKPREVLISDADGFISQLKANG